MVISHAGKLPEGKVCRHALNAPDLVRLFCDTAGVNIPWETHGRDVRPLLRDPESSEWDHPMLMTHTARSYGSDTDAIPTGEALTVTAEVPWYALLRDGKYKYIRTFVAGEVEEVYDLDADPEELVNLALKPEHQALLVRLRERAIAELRRTNAGFVDTMPPTAAMK